MNVSEGSDGQIPIAIEI